ncbi:MAG: hypothetical protein IPN10_16905 [Saprospiraceae bacterium]|nr:hypothetical protein [Saprospiraceae bacterium]
MRQNGLSVLLIFVLSASTWAQQDISIHFAPKPVIIDGHLEEWQLPLEIKHTSSPFYRNQVLCGLYWDYEYLLAAFKVSDSQLCVNATGNNNTRLYLNDAIEIYIDCKNDSQDKMDLNDYQILISLTGEKQFLKETNNKYNAVVMYPKTMKEPILSFKQNPILMVLSTMQPIKTLNTPWK